MTFPAPPMVALAYYTAHIVAGGLVFWLFIRRQKLPESEDSQPKRFVSLRTRYWLAIAAVLVMWVVVQVLLAEFVPASPVVNP